MRMIETNEAATPHVAAAAAVAGPEHVYLAYINGLVTSITGSDVYDATAYAVAAYGAHDAVALWEGDGPAVVVGIAYIGLDMSLFVM